MSKYVPRYPCSDVYTEAPIWIELMDPENSAVHAGCAKWSGITAPGFRTRRVYRLDAGPLDQRGGFWVYDDGKFVESAAWHEAERAAGRYPVDDSKPVVKKVATETVE